MVTLSQSYIYCQEDFTDPEIVEFASGQAAVFTRRSPVKETPNEDSVALLPYTNGGVLIVADGLGGLPAGATASQQAVETFNRLIEKANSGDSLRNIILDGFEQSNQTILDQGVGSATTLVAAEIQGNQVRTYHVGDSVALVVGQRGKTKSYTIPHSPTGYAMEAEVLNEKEAVHHKERHIVSNVVGAQDMSIEISTSIDLAKYDTLLLASDGLFDNFYSDEIVEKIRKGPLKRIADELASSCLQRMQNGGGDKPSKADDLSFILYRMG